MDFKLELIDGNTASFFMTDYGDDWLGLIGLVTPKAHEYKTLTQVDFSAGVTGIFRSLDSFMEERLGVGFVKFYDCNHFSFMLKNGSKITIYERVVNPEKPVFKLCIELEDARFLEVLKYTVYHEGNEDTALYLRRAFSNLAERRCALYDKYNKVDEPIYAKSDWRNDLTFKYLLYKYLNEALEEE